MQIGTIQTIVLLITGAGVGFASGLLGVGGCFIMVPEIMKVLSKNLKYRKVVLC